MVRRGEVDWRVEQERFARAEARELEQDRRVRDRELAAEEKEAEKRRKEGRRAEADAETAALEAWVEALGLVLSDGVTGFAPSRLADRRRTVRVAELDLGGEAKPVPEPVWQEPRLPGPVRAALGGHRHYERKLEDARRRHAEALERAHADETARQRRVGERRRLHAAERRRAESEVAVHNTALDDLQQGLDDRAPEAVERVAEIVLGEMPQPDGLPRHPEVVVSPEGDHVVVRWTLPGKDVVPAERAVQYLVTKDEKRPLARARKDAAAIYRDLVAQVSLLVVRSVLVSDPGVARVSFSGHVDAINPATGEQDYPCLLSLTVERSDLPTDENLRRVDAGACVTALGALVSAHPYAQEPVEPFLDFDLTRFAFIEGLDAVSILDSRPNLLDVSPSLFEHLVRQVLMQKGDEGWTTTQSNDDGVDAVILNRSTIMGGLSVVQAKRYKPSAALGPAHIRELAGTMEEEKAGGEF